MQYISLNSIKTFVVAAHHLSFKKAAEQLNVTPGAISRQIRSLEIQLGVVLFKRKHREVQLNEVGVDYLKLVKPALKAIDSANHLIINRSKKQLLKVQTSPTFALHWLIPRLSGFKQLYPEIHIEITTSSFAIDPDPTFNFYIRRDPAQFSGLNKRPFVIEYSCLVCAPDVLCGSGNLLELLQSASLISNKTRPELWRHWFSETEINYLNKERDINFENTIFTIQAAVEGLGIALIPHVFLTEFLRSQALVIPFGTQPIATGHYHVLTQSVPLSMTEQLFLNWLEREGALVDNHLAQNNVISF